MIRPACGFVKGCGMRETRGMPKAGLAAPCNRALLPTWPVNRPASSPRRRPPESVGYSSTAVRPSSSNPAFSASTLVNGPSMAGKRGFFWLARISQWHFPTNTGRLLLRGVSLCRILTVGQKRRVQGRAAARSLNSSSYGCGVCRPKSLKS